MTKRQRIEMEAKKKAELEAKAKAEEEAKAKAAKDSGGGGAVVAKKNDPPEEDVVAAADIPKGAKKAPTLEELTKVTCEFMKGANEFRELTEKTLIGHERKLEKLNRRVAALENDSRPTVKRGDTVEPKPAPVQPKVEPTPVPAPAQSKTKSAPIPASDMVQPKVAPAAASAPAPAQSKAAPVVTPAPQVAKSTLVDYAYTYRDPKTGLPCIAADLWAVKRLVGRMYDITYALYVDGELDHELTADELHDYHIL